MGVAKSITADRKTPFIKRLWKNMVTHPLLYLMNFEKDVMIGAVKG